MSALSESQSDRPEEPNPGDGSLPVEATRCIPGERDAAPSEAAGPPPATLISGRMDHPDTIKDLPKTIMNPDVAPMSPAPAAKGLGRIGNYEILSQLGEGGMGVVYKAKHIQLPLVAAIKQIRSSAASANTVARFRAEASAMAKLQHPNIVRVLDFGEHDGAPYYVLEFVTGGALTDKLQGKPQEPHWSALMLERVARAVQAAHELGFIHRDLKPPNILISDDGEPKITDFGLVKILEDDEQPEIPKDGFRPTIEGEIMGSPNYMSPEQAKGEISRIGPHTDVYGLGAILYEMLTGRPPFVGTTINKILEQVRDVEPLRPSLIEPHVPRDLETICLRCLEKEPARRIASCRELADALRCYLNNEPIPYQPIGTLERALKWSRRKPATAGLLGVILLATLGLIGGALWYNTKLSAALALTRTAQAHAEENLGLAKKNLDEAHLHLSEALAFKARLEMEGKQPLHAMVYLSAARLKADTLCVRAMDYAVSAPLALYERRLVQPEQVMAIAFDPSGKHMASALRDDSVILWEAASGRRVASLKGHAKPVLSLAYSPDGRQLAVGASDGTIHLWDPETGAEIKRLRGHAGPVYALAFSPDGAQLASGGLDLEVRLWDPSSAKVLATLKGHHDVVDAIAFHPKASLLASGSLDRSIRLWDLSGKKPVRLIEMEGPRAGVTALSFSPDGALLAGGSEDQRICLWDVESGREERVLVGHRKRVRSVAFNPAGNLLVSGADDEDVVLWNVASGDEAARLQIHSDAITSTVFSSDGERLATASQDRTIRFWSISSETRGRLMPVREELFCIGVSPDGKWVAAGAETAVYVWERPVKGEPRVLEGHAWDVTGVAFSPDSRTFATSSDDGTVRIWNVADGRQEALLKGADNFSSVAFSPDGKRIVAGSWDRSVWVWDASTREHLAQLRGHSHYVSSIAFSPDGARLASGSWDRSIRFWELSTGKETGRMEVGERVNEIVYHPSGSLIAARLQDENVALLSVERREVIASLAGHRVGAGAIAFSPNGEVLATAAGDGTISLWDTASRQERARWFGHSRKVTSLIFCSDSGWLISTSEDREVCFFGGVVPEAYDLAQRLSGLKLRGLDLVPLTEEEEQGLIRKYPECKLQKPNATVQGASVDSQ